MRCWADAHWAAQDAAGPAGAATPAEAWAALTAAADGSACPPNGNK